MENNLNFTTPIIEKAEQYGKTTIELFRLKALYSTSNSLGQILSRLIIITLVCVSLISINIGVALWLGELLGRSYLGFFSVAGFYFILGILLAFVFQNKMKKKITNLIIEKYA